jgi:hypothetical protein
LPTLVAEAQPHVAAIAALLRVLIEGPGGQGIRAALRGNREGLDAQQARFLAAVAADRRLGAAERYSIYRSVAELRGDDPAPGTFAGIVGVLDTMDAAHASLAAAGADADGKVGQFEAAVGQLGALTEASRRAAPGMPPGALSNSPPGPAPKRR